MSDAGRIGQAEKARLFRELHDQPGGFIIPNPWDAGSARILERIGFKALASTSAGFAFSSGLPDNGVTRTSVIAHLGQLAAATDLPINADLEGGFANTPEGVGDTIRLAARAGVVGGSIEDSLPGSSVSLRDIPAATERVRAAVEAARGLAIPFLVTARAENFFVGQPDLADTIRRLQAYQDAGADVLFAPGLKDRSDIEVVLRSIDRPLNVMIGFPGMELSASELIAMGVKRVSVGGSLARAALGELWRAGVELRDSGSARYAQNALSGRNLNQWFGS